MPKLFDYLGFIFFFYSNDHLPVHCHVKKGDKEVKVEMEFVKNRLTGLQIRMANRKTKKLTPAERAKIRKFVWTYQEEIKQKWEDFRAGKAIKMEKISREIK